MTDDEPNLAAKLAYMAKHPKMFTKKEMAIKLAEAAEVLGMMQRIISMQAAVELEEVEPEGAS